MTGQCLPTFCTDVKRSHPVARLPDAQTKRLTERLAQVLKLPFEIIRQRLAISRQRRLNRRTLVVLSSLSDSSLKDIGLNRGDLTWASNLPESTNASVELEIISRRRTRSERI